MNDAVIGMMLMVGCFVPFLILVPPINIWFFNWWPFGRRSKLVLELCVKLRDRSYVKCRKTRYKIHIDEHDVWIGNGYDSLSIEDVNMGYKERAVFWKQYQKWLADQN
jgi:hypothetical protein